MASPNPSRQPDRLPPGRLIALTRFYAAEWRAGRLDLPGGLGVATGDGAGGHVRVHGDGWVDVWIIGWAPGTSTRLHDHGGSAGAFAVLRGELAEQVWSPGTGPLPGSATGAVRDRRHRTGTGVAFGPDRVHDVRNPGDAPALSVHAYSGPLRRLTYFAATSGLLQPVSTVDTDEPEPTEPSEPGVSPAPR